MLDARWRSPLELGRGLTLSGALARREAPGVLLEATAGHVLVLCNARLWVIDVHVAPGGA
jgi:hypothetical protein